MSKKNNIWGSVAKLGLIFWSLPKNTFCSIDVTNKCNLRCAHCYFYSYDQQNVPELSAEEWLAKIEKMQSGRGKFFSCTWVGGEPLLRKDIIDKGRKFFRSNRVVTNGTIPLPDWRDVDFHISIDGTKELHDSIRGEGCYEKIKKNLSDPVCKELKIVLACCLNRKNARTAEDLVKEWRKVPHIKNILFDFFTPIKGEKEDLWLGFTERDEIIETLEKLRAKYGSFIGAPPMTFDLMRMKNRHKAIGRNCVFIGHGTAFDAAGNIKKPCVMGPKADCDRCGCIVPFSIKAWKNPKNLLREVFHHRQWE